MNFGFEEQEESSRGKRMIKRMYNILFIKSPLSLIGNGFFVSKVLAPFVAAQADQCMLSIKKRFYGKTRGTIKCRNIASIAALSVDAQ